MSKSQFFSVSEVATILGVHRVTVVKMIKENPRVGAFKVGRQWRIPKSFLEIGRLMTMGFESSQMSGFDK